MFYNLHNRTAKLGNIPSKSNTTDTIVLCNCDNAVQSHVTNSSWALYVPPIFSLHSSTFVWASVFLSAMFTLCNTHIVCMRHEQNTHKHRKQKGELVFVKSTHITFWPIQRAAQQKHIQPVRKAGISERVEECWSHRSGWIGRLSSETKTVHGVYLLWLSPTMDV